MAFRHHDRLPEKIIIPYHIDESMVISIHKLEKVAQIWRTMFMIETNGWTERDSQD